MDICSPTVDDGSYDHAAMVLEGLMECFLMNMLNSRAQTKNKVHKQKGNFYRRIAEMLLSIRKMMYVENHPEVKGAYTFLFLVHSALGNKEEAYKLSELMTQCKDPVPHQYFARILCDENGFLARQHKDVANNFFKSGDYLRALEFYGEALNLCPNDAKLLTNRAATYVKLSEQHEHSNVNEQRRSLEFALQDSVNATAADSAWMKGYYWKAVCLAKLGKRGSSLAAAAIAEHRFPSQCTQIRAVVDHFGPYDVRVVNTVENLLHATERTDSNAVVLLKEGRYELPKPLKPPNNAVMVGLGNVQIICPEGDPLQLDKTVYVENITLSPII